MWIKSRKVQAKPLRVFVRLFKTEYRGLENGGYLFANRSTTQAAKCLHIH